MHTNEPILTEFELYKQAQAAGLELGQHESDLHLRVSPEAEALIARYQFKRNVTRFRSPDGTLWFDVPFAYAPFWEKKQATHI